MCEGNVVLVTICPVVHLSGVDIAEGEQCLVSGNELRSCYFLGEQNFSHRLNEVSTHLQFRIEFDVRQACAGRGHAKVFLWSLSIVAEEPTSASFWDKLPRLVHGCNPGPSPHEQVVVLFRVAQQLPIFHLVIPRVVSPVTDLLIKRYAASNDNEVRRLVADVAEGIGWDLARESGLQNPRGVHLHELHSLHGNGRSHSIRKSLAIQGIRILCKEPCWQLARLCISHVKHHLEAGATTNELLDVADLCH
mmetsp:Transcript_58233/g.138716  ORF Transcript_58233/g.138716 Transcript_58233/m.138716 type:complete len:249 (-) Transcript_58233:585-1331(-)